MNAPISVSAWCTFRVGALLFGLDVALVREVLRPLPITPLPGAPATLRGLLHLRGQIVPAVDMRACLGLPRAPDGAQVVIFADGEPISLIVDSIGGVQSTAGCRCENAPHAAHSALAAMAPFAVTLAGQLLLLLDHDRLLDVAFAPAPGLPIGGKS